MIPVPWPASWREVKEAMRAITPICTAHDDDGVDVYFLNAKNSASQDSFGGWKNIRSAEQVEILFNQVRPHGTPTCTRINQIMKPYLRAYEQAVAASGDPDNSGFKPVNMIFITDGVPTDGPESAIVSIANHASSTPLVRNCSKPSSEMNPLTLTIANDIRY